MYLYIKVAITNSASRGDQWPGKINARTIKRKYKAIIFITRNVFYRVSLLIATRFQIIQYYNVFSRK